MKELIEGLRPRRRARRDDPGGITYFHEYAYDLLADNERILASTFDAAIHTATRSGALQRASP